MSQTLEIKPSSERELVIQLLLDAPRDKLYQCWTKPELIKQWFAPKPWTVSKVENDVRAGGSSVIVMKSPEGQEFPNPGVFLEVIPNQKLVFTDAYTSAWIPSQKPFMTGIVTFEEAAGGKTLYTARVQHWNVADREQHEKMGFRQGWTQCANQLEELASKL